MSTFLWRCYNPKCTTNPAGKPGYDYATDDPKGTCPKCGLATDHPRHGGKIVRRVPVHFETPDEIVEGSGSGIIACTGGPAQGRYTRAPSAVTCPKCLETEIVKRLNTGIELHPDYLVPGALPETLEVKGGGS
jgi:ssDNA-binding Zn-finger/Zn-ribbon topoisomerase 1